VACTFFMGGLPGNCVPGASLRSFSGGRSGSRGADNTPVRAEQVTVVVRSLPDYVLAGSLPIAIGTRLACVYRRKIICLYYRNHIILVSTNQLKMSGGYQIRDQYAAHFITPVLCVVFQTTYLPVASLPTGV
jgi:hypothetical protein